MEYEKDLGEEMIVQLKNLLTLVESMKKRIKELEQKHEKEFTNSSLHRNRN